MTIDASQSSEQILGVSSMHIATLTITSPLRDKQKLMKTVNALSAQTARSPGCLECSVYSGIDPGGAILVLERWRSEEDLRRHRRSDAHRRLCESVGSPGTQSESRAYTVVASAGLELVEAVRCPEQA